MLSTNSRNGLQWYSSSKIPVSHGMFSRSGGKSNGDHSSLNLSFGVGDSEENVLNNRERAKQVLNISHLVSSRQIHGDMVTLIEPVDSDRELEGYDALITDQPGVGLLIQQADCQAILLHDPHRHVIAAIHNGWRGSVANIIAKTIRSMQDHFPVRPEDIRAAISPSLGPCCGEFIKYRQELPPKLHSFQKKQAHFDFWAISRRQLQQAGIPESQIETCAICTVCNEDFFSYRRAIKLDNGVTGRNGSIIALPA